MTAAPAPTAPVQIPLSPFLALDSGLTLAQQNKPDLFEVGHICLGGQLSAELGPNASLLADRLILRHRTGDWGDIDAEDKARNTWAITNAARIVSVYNLLVRGSETNETRCVLVLTEDDRSVTTVLFPSER